jgi:hypothetical protein
LVRLPSQKKAVYGGAYLSCQLHRKHTQEGHGAGWPIEKITKTKGTGAGVTQVVEYLPSNSKALNSKPSTKKGKKEGRKTGREER